MEKKKKRNQTLSVNEQESEKSCKGVSGWGRERKSVIMCLTGNVPVKWLAILLYGFGGKAGGCFSANALVRGISLPSFGSEMPFAGDMAGAGFGVWPARHNPVSPANCDSVSVQRRRRAGVKCR